jgi:hypothetical protein
MDVGLTGGLVLSCTRRGDYRAHQRSLRRWLALLGYATKITFNGTKPQNRLSSEHRVIAKHEVVIRQDHG